MERLGVSPEKIRVVSSTWDPALLRNDSALLRNDSALLRNDSEGVIDELGDGPVVLYPAATHPHKNHLTLLGAVDQIADRHGGLTLVLTGGAGRDEAVVCVPDHNRIRVRVLRFGRVDALITVGVDSAG